MASSILRVTACGCLLVSASSLTLAGTQDEVVSSYRAAGVPAAEVIVTLERTGCLGSCPVYKLTLNGTGEVIYEGRRFVKSSGSYSSRIAEKSVLELANSLLTRRFFDAGEEYAGHDRIYRRDGRLIVTRTVVQDGPSMVLSLTIGRYTRTVRVKDSDPLRLGEVADAIDRAADVENWIGAPCERSRPIGPPLSECENE